MCGADPSMAGKASTIESLPLRQLGPVGATAPTIPGVVRSFAAIGPGAAPRSTSTLNGSMTPGDIPALASASRPTIASPLPG